MTNNLNKTALKMLIQKSSVKNILYLRINSKDPDSYKSSLKELEKFMGNGCVEVMVIRV